MVMKKLLTAVAFISYICQCSSQKYYYKFQDPYKNSLSVYNGQSAPDDYKELESPNSYKADHLINEEKHGKCNPYDFQCKEVFPSSISRLFECNHDYQCPRTYKCCEVNCFAHKVCQPFIATEEKEKETTKVQQRTEISETTSTVKTTTVDIDVELVDVENATGKSNVNTEDGRTVVHTEITTIVFGNSTTNRVDTSATKTSLKSSESTDPAEITTQTIHSTNITNGGVESITVDEMPETKSTGFPATFSIPNTVNNTHFIANTTIYMKLTTVSLPLETTTVTPMIFSGTTENITDITTIEQNISSTPIKEIIYSNTTSNLEPTTNSITTTTSFELNGATQNTTTNTTIKHNMSTSPTTTIAYLNTTTNSIEFNSSTKDLTTNTTIKYSMSTSPTTKIAYLNTTTNSIEFNPSTKNISTNTTIIHTMSTSPTTNIATNNFTSHSIETTPHYLITSIPPFTSKNITASTNNSTDSKPTTSMLPVANITSTSKSNQETAESKITDITANNQSVFISTTISTVTERRTPTVPGVTSNTTATVNPYKTTQTSKDLLQIGPPKELPVDQPYTTSRLYDDETSTQTTTTVPYTIANRQAEATDGKGIYEGSGSGDGFGDGSEDGSGDGSGEGDDFNFVNAQDKNISPSKEIIDFDNTDEYIF